MTRRLWLQWHRLLGLCLALPLLLIGISGSIIVYDPEIDTWLNPELFHVSSPGANPLPPSALIGRIESEYTDARVTYLSLDDTTSKGSIAYVEPRGDAALEFDELFIDPVSGDLNGTRMWGACCFEPENFVPFMYKLHNRLLLPIDVGRTVNGFIAFAWVVLLAVGLMLLPERKGIPWLDWIKTLLFFRGRRRKLVSWHRTLGLWMWPALMLLAVTGVGLGFEQSLHQLITRLSPLSEPPHVPTPITDRTISVDQALALARTAVASHGATEIPQTPAYVSIPDGAGYFRVRFGGFYLAGLRQRTVYVASDGRVAGIASAAGHSSGDLLIGSLQPLHAGRIGGPLTRLFICIGGLVTTFLAASGLLLWSTRRPHIQP